MSSQTNLETNFITLQEAARELQCHPNTLRKWDREGILPAVRFGKRGDRRYRKQDLIDFVKRKSIVIDPQSTNPSEVEKTIRQIYKAGLRLLVPMKIDDTFHVIIREALKLVDGDYGSIYLYNKNKLTKVYTSLQILNEIQPTRNGNTYRAFTEKKVYVIDVTQVNEHRDILEHLDIKSTVFIPLAYEGMSVGVLSIDSCHASFFNQKTLEVLKLFGSMAALKIINTQLYAQLSDALETRDLFISMAAHELKTPLTSIHGYAQLIEKKAANKDVPPINWATMLVRETARARNLIAELLHVEQIKTKKLQFQMKKHNLRSILQRSIENFGISHPKREIIFEDQIADMKPYVLCDIDKMLQVLMNLYNNAAKFSDQSCAIRVVLGKKSGKFCVDIIDKGKGISPSELNKIFRVFYKGKNNTKEGLGLGLYLSKYIVDQHNGVIELTSEKDKGTTVSVRLQIYK